MKKMRISSRRLKIGLAPRLIGFTVLTALLTGVLVGAVLIQNSRNVLREHILASNFAAADLAVKFAANYIEGVETSLRQFAARKLLIHAVLEKNLQEAEKHLSQILETSELFDSAAIYNVKGIGWAGGLKDKWQNRGGSVADREWFQQTLATQRPYFGIPVISRGTGHPVAVYAIPIFDNKGELNAILVGGISLAALSQSIAGLNVNKAARSSLLDTRQGGLIIAHPDPKLILTPITGRNQAELHALAGERGSMEITNSGESDLASFAPVSGLPWSVLILEPVESAYAPLNSLTIQAVLYVSAIVFIAVVLGILIARSMVRPVRQLVRGTKEIGQGNLDFRIETKAHNEIGWLAEAFNNMTSDLKTVTASHDELNKEIIERKRAEERLREVNQELQRSNRELEQFAYVASHDLQEPLRMVSSYTQLLAQRYKDMLDQDAREFIAFSVDGANRMQRLIQDLLSYSRISTRGRTPGPVDTGSALGEVLLNLQAAITESGALVTNDDLPEVMADYTQLVLLLQNLIGNAIKFRKPDDPPRVHVSAVRAPDDPRFWMFRMADNGIGIDPKYFERIFVIFQRLHGREEYPGTGIGLAICQRIVNRHGGRLWVESEPGRGSTFFFTLCGNMKGEKT